MNYLENIFFLALPTTQNPVSISEKQIKATPIITYPYSYGRLKGSHEECE